MVRLDRLVRSLTHLTLEAKGAHFRSLGDPLDHHDAGLGLVTGNGGGCGTGVRADPQADQGGTGGGARRGAGLRQSGLKAGDYEAIRKLRLGRD